MNFKRHVVIGAGLALAGGAAAAVRKRTGGNARKNGSSGLGKIDVHQHLLPPEFLAALERQGLMIYTPVQRTREWTYEAALAMMDENEIATGILSLSAPGPRLGTDAEGRVLARQINERQAALVQRRPDRFGMFACVPLPDIQGSVEAIAHAYDNLSTDGVVLLANYQGVYLGDPTFDPVMEELDRRKAVVLVHPTMLFGPLAKGISPSAVDFLLDTSRAALSLVANDIPRRFPGIRFILSHAGGFIPYAAYRVAIHLKFTVNSKVIEPAEMLSLLSNFYFDTALSASPTVLPSLLPFARPGHVLFGSDFPYTSSEEIGYFAGNIESYKDLDAAGRQAIYRTNAEALFPRLEVAT